MCEGYEPVRPVCRTCGLTVVPHTGEDNQAIVDLVNEGLRKHMDAVKQDLERAKIGEVRVVLLSKEDDQLSKNREAGWYWAKVLGRWECAEYKNGFWDVVGTGLEFYDDDIDDIGPRIEKPADLD